MKLKGQQLQMLTGYRIAAMNGYRNGIGFDSAAKTGDCRSRCPWARSNNLLEKGYIEDVLNEAGKVATVYVSSTKNWQKRRRITAAGIRAYQEATEQ